MSFENLSEDHVPAGAEIFLDTSIHCCNQKGTLFKSRVQGVLQRFGWRVASSYSKTEFGNVVLSKAEYLLRKLDELGSLEKCRDFVANVLPHQFHGGIVTWTFNLLNRVYGANDQECTERARLSLERLMKFGTRAIDVLSSDQIVDGTECIWARRGAVRGRDGQLEWKKPDCRRAKKLCNVDGFFTQNRDSFLRVKAAIEALPPAQRTAQMLGFVEAIDNAVQDPTSLLDYRTGCRRLADAIIAVDSLEFRNVFTQNVKESELLCGVFGQHLYYLPPNPAGGIQFKPHAP